METFKDIIFNEFITWGYSQVATIDKMSLFKSNTAIDYWLVSPQKFDLNNQKALFDEVCKLSDNLLFIEKNISFLILADFCSEIWNGVDIVKMENDKAYFKKYILSYTENASNDIIKIMQSKSIQSIADLLMDNATFEKAEKAIDEISSDTLLYTIAHKLPFIPIKVMPKERVQTNLIFSKPKLLEELDWVNNAPTSKLGLQEYIQKLIPNNHEAD